MKHSERFTALGPPGMARRFQSEDKPPLLQEAKLTAQANDKAEWIADPKLETAKAALVEVEKPKRKGGRPPKHADKPWEAEGITRVTWYRRRKAKEEKA